MPFPSSRLPAYSTKGLSRWNLAAETGRVVLVRDGHASTCDAVARCNLAEAVGQLVLWLGKEPNQGRARQHRPENFQASVQLVMKAGDDNCFLRDERHTNTRRPEQVRGKNDGVVAVPMAQNVLEETGHGELEAQPADLVVEVREGAGLYGQLRRQRRPAVVAHDGEPPHGEPIFLARPLRELVGPGVVVDRASREHFDLEALLGEPERCLPRDVLRPPEHAGPETGRNKGQLHLAPPP